MHVAVVEEYVKNLNTYLEMKINIKINNTSHNSDSFLQNYGFYFDKKRDLIKYPVEKYNPPSALTALGTDVTWWVEDYWKIIF